MGDNQHNVIQSLIWAFAFIVFVIAGAITIGYTTHDNNQTQVQLKGTK